MDLLLVFLMSLDALLACVACGARGVTLPGKARVVIAGVGTACLALSFTLSRLLSQLLPPFLFHVLSCGALFLIALLCLFDEVARRLADRLAARCAKLQLHFGRLRLVLEVYAESARADSDHSGVLSPAEALMLALPLSLDSLLTGLSIHAAGHTALLLLLFSFLWGLLAATIGGWLGGRLRHGVGQSASLLGGGLMLAIAVCKWLT